MIALDADVLTDYLVGRPDYVVRLQAVPQADIFVPVVVAEEILRGRLDLVRRAEAGRGPHTLEQAYRFFGLTVAAVGRLQLLLYTASADGLFHQWRAMRLGVKTHDSRIGAICVAHSAVLVTRNRRDFALLPGLQLDVWP